MAINLEDFLALHNRLSPFGLQASMELLVRFHAANKELFNGDMPAEKIRRPFIDWMLEYARKNDLTKPRKGEWVTFPRPSN